ncbi:formate dehydrogenase family accessory protein FdhD [Caulobacter sp. AP07]|uniref:formate dehydrogenase accessory sulfurtransferase FdhD n=1 Tax=Caulobacter sp. AP07 TaxID=1144304 RepID=UPI000271EDD4|nr:formate dehydrogenase accessory sulfurtransferase FdhD [Caulobacter sp. AP07]EJL30796.1 formate dehydrogenase family accessory protein FdhD [Caulobacter sp. AP07]
MHQDLSTRRSGQLWRVAGSPATIDRATPQETAIALSFDRRPHTVLMASPADVEDLAIGFTITEGVASYGAIAGAEISVHPDGLMVDIRLHAAAPRTKARPRGLEGRSSCGLCGVQRLADAIRPLPFVTAGQVFTHQAIQRALEALERRQPLGALTRATHAAAFAFADGALGPVREDVGRHNALDKLGGALMRAAIDPSLGFIVVTSRCSFEMVEKVARLDCPMIVAISAPTDLAISKAQAAGVTLVALARADGHTVFSGAERFDPAAALCTEL